MLYIENSPWFLELNRDPYQRIQLNFVVEQGDERTYLAAVNPDTGEILPAPLLTKGRPARVVRAAS